MQVEVGYVGFKIDAVVLPNLISVTSVRKLFAEGKWQSLFELMEAPAAPADWHKSHKSDIQVFQRVLPDGVKASAFSSSL